MSQKLMGGTGSKTYYNSFVRPQIMEDESSQEGFRPGVVRKTGGTPLKGLLRTGLEPVDSVSDKLVDFLLPPEENATAYLSSVEYPGQGVANVVAPRFRTAMAGEEGPQFDVFGTAKATANNLFSMAHPLLKAPYEYLSGEDTFTGQKWKNKDTTFQKTFLTNLGIERDDPIGGLVHETARFIQPGLDMVPFLPRLTQTVGKLTDTERNPNVLSRLGQFGVDATMGMKIRNISDSQRQWEEQEAINLLLQGDPSVRSHELTYVPEELQHLVNPMTLQLLERNRQISRDRRAQ